MISAAGLPVRWSIGRVEDVAGLEFSLLGTEGKAVLRLADNASAWRLNVHSRHGIETHEFAANSPLLTAIECIKEGSWANCPQWLDAVKAVELTEAVERSLIKGRTVEIQLEQASEAGNFKGLMTSVGCGILILGLVLIAAAAVSHRLAVAAGMHGLADLLEKWPYLFLLLLGLFLLLQALLRVAQPSQTEEPFDAAKGEPPDQRKS